jgi:hypothetical protein
MPVTINASTSTGLVQSADTSGEIQLQSNGTTELTVTSTGVSVADNLSFNSGYGSSAVAYGCRAWVNFTVSAAGAVSVRGSGNVSSITRNGVSDYTINFSTAMSDANYSTVGISGANSTSSRVVVQPFNLQAPATNQVRIQVTTSDGNLSAESPNVINVAIFR